MPVASLGMYDPPELHDANDTLWRAIREWLQDHGLDHLPEHLDRGRPLAQIWDDPTLVLAQTCGFPFVTRWHGRLRYVATPGYDAPGCDGPTYRSLLVVSSDSSAATLADVRGTTVAINEPSSNSGCNLLAAAVAPFGNGRPFFSSAILTGSHIASAQAVAAGHAAIAALDAVTFAHLRRHQPGLVENLRVIASTPVSPGLPYVTGANASDEQVDMLCRAIAWAMTASELRTVREALLLTGAWQVPMAQYAALASLSDADGHTCPKSLSQ